jgi:2-keto-3-deoxy-6-phosphogluconate aldolase
MAVLKKPLIAVGGIGLGNINELLAVCAAVGLGSALYQRGKNWREIERDLQAIQTELKNGGETEQNWVGKYTKAHKVF